MLFCIISKPSLRLKGNLRSFFTDVTLDRRNVSKQEKVIQAIMFF